MWWHLRQQRLLSTLPIRDADVTVAEFFQGHFILMSDEEKKQAIARLEKRYSAQYGKKTTVSDAPAPERVLFGYALDISKCIGCRRCVHACVKENNQSRHDPEVQWIQVMKMPKGNISFTADQLDKGYPEKSEFGDYGVQVGGNAYKTAGLSTEDAAELLQRRRGAGQGLFLHAGPVPAVREAALRQGLPCAGNLP